MSTEETRALVLRLLQEAGATGDLAAAVRNQASPQLRIHLTNGEEGGIDLAAGSAQEIYAAFPDASLTLDAMVVEGDRAVLQFVMTGTHTGPIRNFAPTGKPVEIPLCIAFRVDGTAIIEAWYYANLFAPVIASYAESHPDETV